MSKVWYVGNRAYPNSHKVSRHVGEYPNGTGSWLDQPEEEAGRYDWGNDGSGTLRLAEALLTDVLGSVAEARVVCFPLYEVLMSIQQDIWTIHAHDLLKSIMSQPHLAQVIDSMRVRRNGGDCCG